MVVSIQGIPAGIRSGSMTTLRTVFGPNRAVITTSAPVTTSAAVEYAVAPASTSKVVLSSVRFQTRTS